MGESHKGALSFWRKRLKQNLHPSSGQSDQSEAISGRVAGKRGRPLLPTLDTYETLASRKHMVDPSVWGGGTAKGLECISIRQPTHIMPMSRCYIDLSLISDIRCCAPS